MATPDVVLNRSTSSLGRRGRSKMASPAIEGRFLASDCPANAVTCG